MRPHLEYAAPVWNSLQKQEVVEIEKVQRRATRVPQELRGLDYEKRLEKWDSKNLETRRIRGDLIQIFKVLNGLDIINWHTGPALAPRSQSRATSANEKRLVRESFPTVNQNNFCHFTSVRHDFFLNRVTVPCNRLNNSQISAYSVNSFKAKLDGSRTGC